VGGPRASPARRRPGRCSVTVRPLLALAVADFRERVRRPAFAMTLIATVVFGYLAAPPARAGYALMQMNEFRGFYDSGYIGTVLALMTGVWLAFAGFYVVKNTVSRDEATGMGQILAATPLRTGTYLFGKFLSNFLVLAAMTGVVALMAVVMVLVRNEASGIDLIRLWLPFLLFPLPMMAAVAGAALLFETVPGLRSGFGNVLWAFGSFVLFVGSQVLLRFAPGSGIDPLGLVTVSNAMRGDVLAQYPDAEEPVLIIGLVTRSEVPERFTWTSWLDIDGGLLLQRGSLIMLGVVLAVVSALWFARFDRTRHRRPRPAAEPTPQTDAAVPTAGPPAVPRPQTAIGGLTPPRFGRPVARLVVGELRVLLSRTPRWWQFGALALIVAGALVPATAATTVLLAVAWLWPVLIWSRLGTQQYEHNVHPLVAAAPASRQRLLAEWLAALLVTAVVGAGPLVRMAVSGDRAGITAWLAGAVFIPTLALALGTLSRSPRTFQATYLLLWLLVITGERTFDFMGAVRDGGRPAGPVPVVVLGVTAVLGVALLVAHQVRYARR
jgi:hypothetical protein